MYRFEVAVGLPLDLPPGLALQMLERVLENNPNIIKTPKIKFI